jgi:hypothetical protein
MSAANNRRFIELAAVEHSDIDRYRNYVQPADQEWSVGVQYGLVYFVTPGAHHDGSNWRWDTFDTKTDSVTATLESYGLPPNSRRAMVEITRSATLNVETMRLDTVRSLSVAEYRLLQLAWKIHTLEESPFSETSIRLGMKDHWISERAWTLVEYTWAMHIMQKLTSGSENPAGIPEEDKIYAFWHARQIETNMPNTYADFKDYLSANVDTSDMTIGTLSVAHRKMIAAGRGTVPRLVVQLFPRALEYERMWINKAILVRLQTDWEAWDDQERRKKYGDDDDGVEHVLIPRKPKTRTLNGICAIGGKYRFPDGTVGVLVTTPEWIWKLGDYDPSTSKIKCVWAAYKGRAVFKIPVSIADVTLDLYTMVADTPKPTVVKYPRVFAVQDVVDGRASPFQRQLIGEELEDKEEQKALSNWEYPSEWLFPHDWEKVLSMYAKKVAAGTVAAGAMPNAIGKRYLDWRAAQEAEGKSTKYELFLVFSDDNMLLDPNQRKRPYSDISISARLVYV